MDSGRRRTLEAGDIYAVEFGGQRYYQSKARKPTICTRCDEGIGPGDVAFRPLDNSVNRWKRLCGLCVIRQVATGAKHLLQRSKKP